MAASPSIELPVLSAQEEAALLAVARLAIESHFDSSRRGELAQAIASMPLAERELGCFVTLQKRGSLRGCIGMLEAQAPLAETLPQLARAAAFEDRRFPPLSHHEWSHTHLSLSLIGPMQAIPAHSRSALLAALAAGEEGLWLTGGGRRATFLPSVWRELPSPDDFLDQLLRKGGWPMGHWPSNLQAWRYRVCELGRET